MKTVWCTKYSLTDGVTERELIEIDGRYAKVKWPGMLNGWNLVGHGDWYPTKEKALARADRMRKDKIKSLRKQIERLESWEVPVKTLDGSVVSEETEHG